MKYSATLLPLEGKYYGTEVEVMVGERKTLVTFWYGEGSPSERELALCDGEVDGGHYETEHSLTLAKLFVAAVNNK